MEISHVIVTEELLVSLLVGREVRYIDKKGIHIALLVGIIDGKKKVYAFRKKGELHHNPPYINEVAKIHVHDYDWSCIDDKISNTKNLKLKEESLKYYNN